MEVELMSTDNRERVRRFIATASFWRYRCIGNLGRPWSEGKGEREEVYDFTMFGSVAVAVAGTWMILHK